MRNVVAFFLLAYALSWLVWASAIAHQRGLTAVSLPVELAPFGVSVAALLVAARWREGGGWRSLLQACARWRVQPVWYLAGGLLAVGVPVAASLIAGVLEGELRLGQRLPPLGAFLALLIGTPLMVVTEELGWRGYAAQRLKGLLSPTAASLLIGLLWACWHIPQTLLPGAPVAEFPFLAFIVATVAQSVIIGWLFNRSGASVPLAALVHAGTNTAVAYGGLALGGGLGYWIFTALICMVAVLLARLDGSLLQRPGMGRAAPA